MSGGSKHWDAVYETKSPDAVSWFRPHLERSLRFVERAGLGPDAAIIDVGGGASTFVDDLLARGFHDVTVLDLSGSALEIARRRLGVRAAGVRWIAADVTRVELPERAFDFWHDRAVFHFLTDAESRARYVDAARRALKPGGHILVATFGPDGPERCSGLDVLRLDATGIRREFGSGFTKVDSETETHETPWGAEQSFVYCYCRANDGSC